MKELDYKVAVEYLVHLLEMRTDVTKLGEGYLKWKEPSKMAWSSQECPELHAVVKAMGR